MPQTTMVAEQATPAVDERSRRRFLLLSLGALGVVYGDIGTSPLYAFRACFHDPGGVPPTRENVLGIMSMIFWALIIVISVKYVGLVLRADNRGEGGILALLALLQQGRPGPRLLGVVTLVGLFGAALLYGDGVLTPAISVLSAVEGLEVVTSELRPYVLPLTALLLSLLFAVQHNGTARVGGLFGPVTLVWFFTIAGLGLAQLIRTPEVLLAVDPRHALAFGGAHGVAAPMVVGTVFLVVTGGEALYADMGHFGRRPIRAVWYSLVLPALLLNYFGQAALLLRSPEAVAHPFFLLAPSWALLPLVALATLATCVASQAIISGVFSLTSQAVNLGYLPRTHVVHTSASEVGQVYVPSANWLLLAVTLVVVAVFQTSTALAGAYGVAVAVTMVVTTALTATHARRGWGWSWPLIAASFGALLLVDLSFLGANLPKIPEGGWVPLALGGVVLVVFTTWRRGRELVRERLDEQLRSPDLQLEQFLRDLPGMSVLRRPGTAVFMTRTSGAVPPVLLHHLRHNGVLQARAVLLTIAVAERPRVPDRECAEVESIGQGFHRVTGHVGFMEQPSLGRVLDCCRAVGLDIAPAETTFYLGRELLVPTRRPGMAMWRERLFAFMSRNAEHPTAFFGLPAERVFEIGIQVEL